MNTTPATRTVSDLTYDDYAVAVETWKGQTAVHVQSYQGGTYQVEGQLDDGTFLVRAERTKVLLHMRVQRVYRQKFTVVLTGYTDQGRDSEGIMLDADQANTFDGFGWVGFALHLLVASGN